MLESEKFGVRTIAINEDTPNDEALWKVSSEYHQCKLVTLWFDHLHLIDVDVIDNRNIARD